MTRNVISRLGASIIALLALSACGDGVHLAQDAGREPEADAAPIDAGPANHDAGDADDAAQPDDAGHDASSPSTPTDGGHGDGHDASLGDGSVDAAPDQPDTGVIPTPVEGASLEVGRTRFGSDFAVRSEVPPGGLLFSVWTRIPDADFAYPWSRGNMDVFVLYGADWHLRCLVGNTGARSASDAFYNANSMLFADAPREQWVGDYSYFSVENAAEAPFRGWVWVAWQVLVSNGDFEIRQWLKFGPTGRVLPANESIVSLADARDTLVNERGWSRDDANAWSPGAATSFQVGADNGYLFHARVDARSDVPTLDELEAIAMRNSPDPSAWADYPFNFHDGAPDLRDMSGHERNLRVGGTLYQGPEGPDL